ncbi:hypothetical protein ACWGCW_39550 [Streptomyces sp. NPDC054933]
MRDSIARALMWVLRLLMPAHGRHSGGHQGAVRTAPAPTPTPYRPGLWRGPSSTEARAIFRAEETLTLTPEQRERYWATAFAEIGVDYPYRYEGDQFTARVVAV